MLSTTFRGVLVTLATIAIAGTSAVADAPNIYQVTLAEPNQTTHEVSTEQVRQILKDGSAVVLDTRSRAEFEAGHIPGARNLDARPPEQVAAVERMLDGDRTKALVLYCNGPFCQASRRLADQLVDAGFTNVRRYQLGIPIWRALGGPTAVELAGVARIIQADKTAVFIDGRSAEDFGKGSLPTAHNAPLADVMSGRLKKLPLPEDDFNRRVVLFGYDAAHARQFAELLSTRPWHNVAFVPGAFEALKSAVAGK
jgi:rhodanese-related sulfurtransferase